MKMSVVSAVTSRPWALVVLGILLAIFVLPRVL
jgi:hypothetical protein